MTLRAYTPVPLEDYISLIEKYAGITVPDTDYENLKRCVSDRAEKLGITAAKFFVVLTYGGEELDLLINRITINETYFFREERQFNILKEKIFPSLAGRHSPVSFWSVTCSTGEEAYSLAAAADAWLGKLFTVYATDINSLSIEKMKTGIYGRNSFRSDGETYHDLIDSSCGRRGGSVQINDSLKKNLRSFRANIYSGPLDGIPDNIDVVFFRNTLIYMKQSVKIKVIERIAEKIAPGGALFLAAPEMPLIKNPGLELTEYNGSYYFTRSVKTASNITAPRRGKVSPSVLTSARQPIPRSLDINTHKVHEAANSFSSDLRFRFLDSDPNNNVAMLIHYFLYFINSLKTVSAGCILGIIEKFIKDETFSHLKGLLYLAEGDSITAAVSFREALKINGEFWPARFHLASILKRSDAAGAIVEFRECGRTISRSIAEGENRFRFLLEGFNEKYFLEICDNWVKSPAIRDRDGVHDGN